MQQPSIRYRAADLVCAVEGALLRPFAPLFARKLLGRSRRLHCGCGGVLLSGWINADLRRTPIQLRNGRGPGLYANLARNLPFPDSTIDYLYSNNFLEHLTREDVIDHLRASLRILTPGGRIRIVVPDIAPYARAYCSGDTSFFAKLPQTSDYWPRWSQPADYLATIFHGSKEHGWVHRWAWDAESLGAALAAVGFAEVKRYNTNESPAQAMAGIDGEPFAVLALEAVKPNASTRHLKSLSLDLLDRAKD